MMYGCSHGANMTTSDEISNAGFNKITTIMHILSDNVHHTNDRLVNESQHITTMQYSFSHRLDETERG